MSIPTKNNIMISVKHAGFCLAYIRIYSHSSSGSRLLLWDNVSEDIPDVFVSYTPNISVSFHAAGCFELLFSFHPPSKTPKKLPSGFFNCSVDFYSSFQEHVDCNLKKECEDGRDEREDCAFSSPECQGLVDMCDSCFQYVGTFKSTKNVFDRLENYCSSLGGRAGILMCGSVWSHSMIELTKLHLTRATSIIVELTLGDTEIPHMYRNELVRKDKTVIYHSIGVLWGRSNKQKLCVREYKEEIYGGDCENIPSRTAGIFCEFSGNKRKDDSSQLEVLLLPEAQSTFKKSVFLTTCTQGHVTHVVFLCGSVRYDICDQNQTALCNFYQNVSSIENVYSLTTHPTVTIHNFICDDDVTELSYSLLCDFIADCPDKSDEAFCKYPVCIKEFRCTSGECIAYDYTCNRVLHCRDGSDESNCMAFRDARYLIQFYLSPVFIYYNSIGYFVSFRIGLNVSCPESHYRCPGEFNDCLPVYTLCNGMYDCVDHMDEKNCEVILCPGFFRCRSSKICVHSAHVCDGWGHCPMNDDELMCNIHCPASCLCQGHSLLCLQPFSAGIYPQVRSLDATGSGMTLMDVSHNTYLVHLVLAKCSLTLIPNISLPNLRILDLSDNAIRHVEVSSLLQLQNLKKLSLSNNSLVLLKTALLPSIQQYQLKIIDLAFAAMTVFDSKNLSNFPHLKALNLSFSSIHTINSGGFQFLPQLTLLYMDGTPVQTFPEDIFNSLFQLKVITTENYKLCCSEILQSSYDTAVCYSPKDEISSCEDLLQSTTYQVFLWLVSCLSIAGNTFCLLARLCVHKTRASSSGFSAFVTNLTVADLMMGIYTVIIGLANERFRGRYLHYDDMWKSSVPCKTAGFLSFVSSEVSAMIIWLITLDRFLVLQFPFSNLRFEKKSAVISCLIVWLVGLFLALIPLLPVTSHWEFYSQTGICIPLPVTRQEFKGKLYSFSIFIILNFVLFLLISFGQAFIYWSIQSNALKINTTKVSQDVTIAQRLVTIAVTDFMCWFPIGLCGILALADVPISGEVNVALSIFVLPLNSAINPFVYTFNTLTEKWRKSNEAKLLKWMESNADLIDVTSQ